MSMHSKKKISVDVRASLIKGEVIFDEDWKDDSPSGSWKKSPINLPPKSGVHEIIFDLDDKTGLNLRFKPDASDAIWVSTTACPKTACNEGGQITAQSVENSGKKLTVDDKNSGASVKLHYTLVMDGDSSSNGPPYYHDPVIINGGGD